MEEHMTGTSGRGLSYDSIIEQGCLLLDQGSFPGALAHFDQAVQLEPAKPDAYFFQGACYQRQGDMAKALHHYSMALQIDSCYRPNLLALAQVLLDLGQNETALQLCEIHLNSHPDDLEICKLQIKCQKKIMAEWQDKIIREIDPVMQRLHMLVRCLTKDRMLKVDVLSFDTIGGMAADIVWLPKLKAAGLIDDVVFFSGNPPNQQLLKMIGERVPVLHDDSIEYRGYFGFDPKQSTAVLKQKEFKRHFFTERYAELFDDCFDFIHSCNGRSFIPTGREGSISELPNEISFSAEDHKRGQAFLEDTMGIPRDAWFILIFSRDPAYFGETSTSPKSFRNAEINNFHRAIDYVVGCGGYVVRVGSRVSHRLDYDHSRVIDYSTRFRNDFMDIYLFHKARLAIGTPSGLTQLRCPMKTPIAHVNTINLGSHNGILFAPKLIRSVRTNEYVPFGDFIRRFYLDPDCVAIYENGPEQTRRYGIYYEENSPEDLAAITEEALQRQQGTFVESESDRALLERYYGLWPSKAVPYYCDTPMAVSFLRKYQELLR